MKAPGQLAGLWTWGMDVERRLEEADPESYEHDQLSEERVDFWLEWSHVKGEA